MPTNDPVQAFEARLSLYQLDDRARRMLAETWPLIETCLEPAIDELLSVVPVLVTVGPTIMQNAALFKQLEIAHFRALLGGKLDRDYAEFLPQHRGAGSGART